MLDWVSDALNWMEDAVSAAWTATVNTTNDIADAVFDAMFEWTYGMVYHCITEIFRLINTSATDIFSLPWVQSFIGLFYNLAWMLFGCGFVVAVFDTAIAYEGGQNNVKNFCLNTLKGFFAASLVTVVPQRLYSFCVNLQGTFAHELIAGFVQSSPSSVISAAQYIMDERNGKHSVMNLLFIILFGYCTVKVILANVKRGGILLCQIAVGSLYMFSVSRGFTDGFYGWCRQVIATCLTVFLQTTILYLGLLTYTQHALLAIGLCLSATEVPRVAQMYGLDTSMRVNMMSVGYTVNMGTKIAGLMKKAG